jgi:hypothetical protein
MRVIVKVVITIHLAIGFAQSQGFAAESFRYIKHCPDALCVLKAWVGGAAILVADETPRAIENDQPSPKQEPPTYIPPSKPNQDGWLLKLIGFLVGTVIVPIVLIALLLSFCLTRFVKQRYVKVLVGIFSAIVTLPVGFVVYSLSLWMASVIDPASAQDDCALSWASKAEYRQLRAQAKAQNWTIWPGLSDGMFVPSPPWLVAPTDPLGFERGIGERLKNAIEELSFDHGSADAQLAAAHAVLRSFHAEFVNFNHIPSFAGTPESVIFVYFIPQRRFAPLCLPCLLFRFTTMKVIFFRNAADTRYFLDRIVVSHGGLKYDPQKAEQRNAVCPEFPTRTPS